MNINATNAANALFGAQQPQKTPQTGFFATETEKTPAEAAFLKRLEKTPAQLMREEILEAMGLKEEDLKEMDGKEREAIERKIEEAIKTRVEQGFAKEGSLIDLKA